MTSRPQKRVKRFVFYQRDKRAFMSSSDDCITLPITNSLPHIHNRWSAIASVSLSSPLLTPEMEVKVTPDYLS